MAPATLAWNETLSSPIPASALVRPHIGDADARCRDIEAQPLPGSVPEVLANAAERFPDRVALHFIEDRRTLTYRQLSQDVARFADGLAQLGVRRGTHVGVMLPNGVEFPVTWLALATLGAVMVPINIAYTRREFEFVAGNAEIEYLVVDEAFLAAAASAWSDDPKRERQIVAKGEGPTVSRFATWDSVLALGSDSFACERPHSSDLLNIQYTSGTTGFPKGCMLTHEYWVVAGKVNAFRDGVVYERILASTPFFYMDPQWLLLMSFFQGATLFVARRQSPSRFLGWLRDYRIHFCLFPQPLLMLPASEEDAVNEVRRANIYGLRPSAHAALEQRFGLNAREAFGMTETGPVMFMPLADSGRIGSGSCGRPGPFRQCRIMREDGTETSDDEAGELQVRGRGILRGYFGNDEATQAALDGDWFRTGDLFRRDAAGYFRIIGRKKDMTRRSAEDSPAREVEVVIQAMPGIEEVAAIAVPDELRGEEVKIFVVTTDPRGAGALPPTAILQHAARDLAPFKVPRYVQYVGSLPKTPSGKVCKQELLSTYGDQKAGCWDQVDGQWR